MSASTFIQQPLTQTVRVELVDGTGTYITAVPLNPDAAWPAALRTALDEAAKMLCASVARDLTR